MYTQFVICHWHTAPVYATAAGVIGCAAELNCTGTHFALLLQCHDYSAPISSGIICHRYRIPYSDHPQLRTRMIKHG